MRICDVTQAYDPSGGGGVAHYLAHKRAFLEARQHEHLLIVPGAEDHVERQGQLLTRVVASPLIPGCRPYRLFTSWLAIRTALRDFQPDVIEFGDPYLAAWAAIAHGRAFPGTAVVSFCHTDTPRAYVYPIARQVLGPRLARWAKKLATCYVASLHAACDAVAVASPCMARSLQRQGTRRVATIPLGVDTTLFHPRRRDRALRVRLGVPEDGFLLVYAGRLNSEKRTGVLLDAICRLPRDLPVVAALIGDGTHRQLALAAAGRDHRVRVLPFTADRLALATLLASADLYVTAAPFETFGLSIVEAQASGLAVAGVRAGALIDRVTSEVGALAPPDSADQLAACITKLLRSDVRERGRRARQLVVERYSWERTFTALLSLYRSRIARPDRPALDAA